MEYTNGVDNDKRKTFKNDKSNIIKLFGDQSDNDNTANPPTFGAAVPTEEQAQVATLTDEHIKKSSGVKSKTLANFAEGAKGYLPVRLPFTGGTHLNDEDNDDDMD